ncbi:MAG: hypothetical protein QHJ73_14090, partial [Armatimonadota bacterium]|nr:hypothetical protein [Armatimonadota bacterium]
QVRRSREAKGAITAFVHGPAYDYVEGEAAAAYGGRLKRFRRQVVHVRPGVFVMFDDVAAQNAATFQWLLHAYDRIQVDETATAPVLRIRRDPAAMNVYLLLPGGLAITQTDRYDPEPESGEWKNTWHLTAATQQPEQQAHFLTVFLPHRVGAEETLPRVERAEGRGALGVRLLFPDGTEEVVAFRTADRGTVECAGVRDSARVFAVGRKDGKETRRLRVTE